MLKNSKTPFIGIDGTGGVVRRPYIYIRDKIYTIKHDDEGFPILPSSHVCSVYIIVR